MIKRKLLKSLWKYIVAQQGLFYKSLLILSSSVLILYIFPLEGQFKYEFQKGKVWQYPDFYSPFDFSILKSEEEIAKDEVAALKNLKPYLWGGKTPMGIDCSGLTQMTYRINGLSIPRDASQQAQLGDTLSFIDESEAGDLAFFDDADGKIIHVGLLLENYYILHAHGKVRIDRIDQTGIYNTESQQHSHKLRIIKKLV